MYTCLGYVASNSLTKSNTQGLLGQCTRWGEEVADDYYFELRCS